MSWITALLFGLIQGLTEFLPVSSSAHLSLAKMALGIHTSSQYLDLSCHFGTLLALLVFLKQDIWEALRNKKKILFLLLALIPLFPSYFLLKHARAYASNPAFLGIFLMGTAGILILGQRLRVKARGNKVRDSLLIGAMQSAALIPGISRSASTISCARVLGWNASEAVRFSFLLAIPTIVGGNLMELKGLWEGGNLSLMLNAHCLLGLVSSFVVGLFVIRFALSFLEKGNLKPFAWYCFALGAGFTLYQIGTS